MVISFLKRQVPASQLIINSSNLSQVSHLKLLGVTIQSDLKWNLLITDIISKASHRLYTLCILKKAKVPVFGHTCGLHLLHKTSS